MSVKLNVLLGRVEHLAAGFKASVADYLKFFSKNQSYFKGIRKTYAPRPDTIDLPSERESRAIVTTVKEKLHWLVDTNKDYIDNLFSVEATNASGKATAVLSVGGIHFGEFTSLELLRLISILESNNLKEMYSEIPVRSDAENWKRNTDELYESRDVYSLPMQSGIKKSITKEQRILDDPNVEKLKDTSKYQPIVTSIDTVTELGDWTVQHFTGEASHEERAKILRRLSRLLVAAKDALKVANDVEAESSEMTSEKLFKYLHEGVI